MRIAELLNKGFYELSQEDKQTLLKEYELRSGSKLCATCTGSFIIAFNELKKMATKKKVSAEQSISECKYEFKEGFENSEVHVRGLSFVITAANLTDELVETYLNDHPHIQVKNDQA